MICSNCGNNVPDGQYTCNVCGAYVGSQNNNQSMQYGQQPQPTYQQGQYYGNTNTYQNLMNQPNTYNMQSYGPALGMKWYNFVIYFMLFLSCVANIWSGFQIMTGVHYDKAAGFEGAKEMMYAYYDGLQMTDFIMGVLCVALGVYAIFVRFALAGYKKKGPLMFILMYVITIGINTIYALMIISIASEFSFFQLYNPLTLIMNLVMIWANYVYFNNRKHLFVN